MNNFFVLRNGVLRINDSHVEAIYEIEIAIKSDSLVIAKILPPTGKIYNRNIVAYTLSGDLAWQIEESPHGTQADKPYMDISYTAKQGLLAGNWNGVTYSVDLHSGRISPMKFEK